MASKSLNVISCIPQQRYTFDDKVDWAEKQLNLHRADLLVLPQEYHGGIQHFFFNEKTNEKVAYAPQEIIAPYAEISRSYGAAIAIGALIDDPDLGQRRERIYLIDPEAGAVGFVDKMFLPAYDHVDAKGRTRVFPETNMENRARAFTLPTFGARVGIMFCWEVYSSFMWHAMARAQPDFALSMIKFGVNGWPQKAKDDDKQSIVTGFGFGGDGGWRERLQMAARWDLAAPIITSTNSWDLPNRANALCGQLLPWEEKETGGQYAGPARVSTLYQTLEQGKKSDPIQEHVQVDQVDFLYWRHIRDHKFSLNEATGEWPRSEARELTMNWKIKRMERSICGLPKLEAKEGSKPFVKAEPVPKGLLY